jgi:hypothetical protein
MSEAPRKILCLVVEGLPEDKRPPAKDGTEIFVLTEANAREALEKIFAADAVSVWGPLL